MKPEVPRMRRFFFAGRRAARLPMHLPVGFAALLLYLLESMVYCMYDLTLAI